MYTATWKKKTKKKKKKLKELSDLQEQTKTDVSAVHSEKPTTSCLLKPNDEAPEGPVHRSVPADEGHRGEEDEPEDGQTKVHAISSVCYEVRQAGKDVEEQSGTVDWRRRRAVSVERVLGWLVHLATGVVMSTDDHHASALGKLPDKGKWLDKLHRRYPRR